MPNEIRTARAAIPRVTVVPYRFEPVVVQDPSAQRSEEEADEPPYEGFIWFQGLEIDVENAAGSKRSGVSPEGKSWSTTMLYPYGDIRHTEGADGDRIDCYVGPNAVSPLVVVIHQQHHDTGEYDEDKCMLGWDDEDQAIDAYLAHYDKPGFYMGHRSMPIGAFWSWLRDPETRGRRVEAAARSTSKRLASLTSYLSRAAAGTPSARPAAPQKPAAGPRR